MSFRNIPIRLDDFGFVLETLLDAMQDLELAHLPAGTNAGRFLGKRRPLALKEKDLRSVMETIAENMRPDLDLQAEYEPNRAILKVSRCPIREICRNRDMGLGGKLCSVFHAYLAGLVSEHLGRVVNPETIRTGNDCCQICMDGS